MKNWQGMIITHPDITKASTKYLAVDLPSSATSGRVNLLGLESLTPTPTTTTTSFPSPTCKTSADCGTENTFCTKTETNIDPVCAPCPESNICPWETTASGPRPEDPEWIGNFRSNFECEKVCRSSKVHDIHYFQYKVEFFEIEEARSFKFYFHEIDFSSDVFKDGIGLHFTDATEYEIYRVQLGSNAGTYSYINHKDGNGGWQTSASKGHSVADMVSWTRVPITIEINDGNIKVWTPAQTILNVNHSDIKKSTLVKLRIPPKNGNSWNSRLFIKRVPNVATTTTTTSTTTTTTTTMMTWPTSVNEISPFNWGPSNDNNTCGPDVGTCPFEKPCCSLEGICGNSDEECKVNLWFHFKFPLRAMFQSERVCNTEGATMKTLVLSMSEFQAKILIPDTEGDGNGNSADDDGEDSSGEGSGDIVYDGIDVDDTANSTTTESVNWDFFSGVMDSINSALDEFGDDYGDTDDSDSTNEAAGSDETNDSSDSTNCAGCDQGGTNNETNNANGSANTSSDSATSTATGTADDETNGTVGIDDSAGTGGDGAGGSAADGTNNSSGTDASASNDGSAGAAVAAAGGSTGDGTAGDGTNNSSGTDGSTGAAGNEPGGNDAGGSGAAMRKKRDEPSNDISKLLSIPLQVAIANIYQLYLEYGRASLISKHAIK